MSGVDVDPDEPEVEGTAGPSQVHAAPPPGPLAEGLVRDELVIEVHRALAPLPPGAPVVVALSGGTDSTALAHLTSEARPDLLITLVHVRHGLRDDHDDLEVVHAHARALGVALEVVEVDVVPTGEGWEAAARSQRYLALRRTARKVGAGWLLVGHTADDQAETVLLRLARGTGLHGIGGMAPARGDLLRPLLRIRRNDVRRFVINEGLDAVEDPTNRDPAYRRTSARYEVLPILGTLGADPVGALARLADLAREDAHRLEADADEVASATTRSFGQVVAVRADTLSALDPALARRVVRRMLLDATGSDDPPSSDHVAAVLTLVPGQALDLHGIRVTCGGGWVAAGPLEPPLAPDLALTVPGVTTWRPGRLEVVATTEDGGDEGPSSQLALDIGGGWRPPVVKVDPAALPPGGDTERGQIVLGGLPAGAVLQLRPRRDGDRVRTAGGTRKVQDVLTDAGVPRVVREVIPVVAHGERVLWIPGLAADDEALRAGRTAPTLHLAVRPIDTR